MVWGGGVSPGSVPGVLIVWRAPPLYYTTLGESVETVAAILHRDVETW
jgi:hypothetical protein